MTVYIERNGKRTNLLVIEVNSSPMVETVGKILYGLFELLRIVKAHDINLELIKLVGFAFPKLDAKGCVVEVELSYNSELLLFNYSCYEITKETIGSEFGEKLVNAIIPMFYHPLPIRS